MGLAGLRVGMAFADAEIIALFNLVKPPYNVSRIAQETILQALENRQMMTENISAIIVEREKLIADLAAINCVEKVYPTDGNFVLVKTSERRRNLSHTARIANRRAKSQQRRIVRKLSANHNWNG